MIRNRQKRPEDALNQNKDKKWQNRWTPFRSLIELCLRFLGDLQRRSHGILLGRVLQERVTLVESESTRVITRRPGIDEDPLLLARKEKEIPMKGKPILIVDDERNIRLTLSQALDPSYGAALVNLERLTSSGWRRSGGIDLGVAKNGKRSRIGETGPQS